MTYDTSKVWSWFILSLFLLSFYYLSYRYPLQYNSATTSYAYSDTPMLYQLGKYAIFAGILLLFLMLLLSLKESSFFYQKSVWVDITTVFVLFTFSVSNFIFMKNDYLLQTGLFFSVPLLFYGFPFQRINYNIINRCIEVFIYVAIIVEVYQLINYYAFGRLPALGYPNSLSVRFGSIWDDPNGFALIIPFLIPFVIKSSFSIAKKTLLIISLLATLLFTQSITGVFTLIMSGLIGLTVLYLFDSKARWLKLIVGILFGMIILYSGFKISIEPSEFWTSYMELKQGSFEGHEAGFLHLENLKPEYLLGFNTEPLGKYAETGYLNLLLNFGIFYLLAFLYIGIVTIKRLAEIIENNRGSKHIRLFYAAFFYVIGFYTAMINLPIETVFPLNLILVLCIVLSYTGKLEGNRDEI
ncbi:hypothetical protein ABES80_05040 [Bacillus gobiensis]|uniref:hypothetical protein n=1 Tax=Bacillus gobiensis TaxID=1441095 RepID=UPI003D1B260F